MRQFVRVVLARIEEVVAASLLALMSGATFANVVARYVFNSPIQWAEEFSRYSFIWLVFMAAVVATTRRRNITIDVLVTYLPRGGRHICRVLVDLMTLILMGALVYYGWVMVRAATQPTATLGIPQYWVYMAVPVSAVLIFCHTLMDFLADVQGAWDGGNRA
jgi:TRAP-type C4-dicarboxylate transport system permease small subunit